MMEHIPVQSSNIASVGFDPELNLLEVHFTNGGRYQYRAVPEAVYQSLLNAESKGKYLAKAVKPHYAATKQAEQKEQDMAHEHEQAAPQHEAP